MKITEGWELAQGVAGYKLSYKAGSTVFTDRAPNEFEIKECLIEPVMIDGELAIKVGDKVQKCTGDYHLEGVVVAVFRTLAGKPRYAVEHQPLAPGLLHIYGPTNLRKI